MNLLWEYGRLNVGEKQRWSKFYGIFLPRIKRLESTCLSLCRRVADFSGVSDDLLRVTIPPSQLPHAMVTVLRIIQVWVFHETVIQFDPATVHIGRFKDGLTLDLLKKSDRIERSHLEQVLSTGRHPFTLKGHCEVRLKGTFSYKVGDVRNRSDVQFFDGFEERLISFSTEKGKSVAWVCFADYMAVYFREEVTKAPDFAEVSPMLFDCMDRSMLVARLSSGKAKRGRGERPCGLWTIHVSTINKPQGHEPDTPWLKFSFVKNKEVVKRLQKLEQELEYFVVASSLESVSFKFPWNAKSDNEKELLSFVLVVRGTNKSVTDVDLKDLLASPNVESSVKKSFDQQKVLFPCTPNSPLSFKSWGAPAATEQTTSWDRPLVKCIPEAARILSILASGRRREHVVRLPSMENTADDNYEEVVLRDLHLNPKQTNITHRWKRFDTSHSVYVETNSVPASAVPMFESEIMYCCCANTIEVGGGGLKAEGLTLLPPGKLFLLLCRVAFGLFRQENVDNGSIIQKSIQWVDPKCQESSKEFLENRINKALKFHFSSLELGEKLECFPEKVEELIAVFNGVDGYESEVWNSLKFNPFIGDNLERNRKKHKRSKQNLSLHKLETESNVLCDTTSQTKVRGTSLSECRVASNQEAVHVVAASSHRDPSISDSNGLNRGHGDERAKIKKQIDLAQPNYIPLVQTRELGEELNGFTRYTAFTTADLNVSERLFTSTLPPGHELNENDLPSSNILAIVVLQVRTETGSAEVGDCMSIDGPDWEVYTITVEGRTWYYAKFLSKDVAFVTRTSKTLSAWLKRTESSRARPNTISAALTCVPPNFAGNVQHKVVVSTNGKQKTLVFECLEMAVRMEAAFWLERQFLSGKRHWYQHHDIGHMVSKLKSEYYLAEKKRNAEN